VLFTCRSPRRSQHKAQKKHRSSKGPDHGSTCVHFLV
jgi:hypothetical protein